MSIEINNESGQTVDEAGLHQVARFVLGGMGIDPLAELSVVLLDADAMAALHVQWMDLPGPTDVMAFPMDGENHLHDAGDASGPGTASDDATDTMLGDVVLCPDVAAQQAKEAGHSTESELALLCTHGILHLLGYDHGEPDEEREMFELQAALLRDYVAQSGRPAIRAPLPGTAGEQRA